MSNNVISGEKLDNDNKMGRQLVPGLLLMPDASLSDQNNIQSYTMGNSGKKLIFNCVKETVLFLMG